MTQKNWKFQGFVLPKDTSGLVTKFSYYSQVELDTALYSIPEDRPTDLDSSFRLATVEGFMSSDPSESIFRSGHVTTKSRDLNLL